MAYDIGTGISEGLGAIGQGMLTRKERQEEREEALGRAEAIGDEKYDYLQTLLQTTDDEGQIKQAQQDYEKWLVQTGPDESTKKIEGYIAEYDKKGLRKTRRLQNNLTQLSVDLAKETNPFKVQQLKDAAEKTKLEIDVLKQGKKQSENLTEFYAGMEDYVSQPIRAEGAEYGFAKETTGVDQEYHALIDKQLDDKGEGVPTPDEILKMYGLRVGGPAATPPPVGEERTGMYSKVPHTIGEQAEAAFHDTPYMPSTLKRQPTAADMASRAQEYLSMKAPGLSPAGALAAEKFVQNRHPRAIPGAPVTYEGEDTGKMMVGGSVMTVPNPDRGMLPLDPDQRVSATSTKWNEDLQKWERTVTTERHVASEEPEYIPMAKAMADEDDSLTYKTSRAQQAGEAKEFKQMAGDAATAVRIVDDVFAAAEAAGDDLMTEIGNRTFNRQIKGEISSLLLMLRGKLRLAVIGPGAVSIYEQEILADVAANPSDIFQWTPASKKKLRVLQRVVNQGIKYKGEHLGLWDYDPELEEGSTLAKGEKRKPMTPKEAERLDKLYTKEVDKLNLKTEKGTATSRDIPSAKPDGTPVKFKSVEEARSQGKPGDWVYVYNQTTTPPSFVPYQIPK